MTFQRFVVLLFLAVLTAGTAAATSVTLLMVADDYGVINVDGQAAIVYGGPGQSNQYITYATLDLSDGWHDISIDYKNVAGPGLFTLFEAPSLYGDGHWVTLTDLRSRDAAGTTINGLRGDYSTLSGTAIATKYGEGPLHYTQGAGAWAFLGSTTLFEEKITGQIYMGPEPAPLGSMDDGGSGGGGDGGDLSQVPEPAGWVFMLAGLPAMLLSRGLRRVALRRTVPVSTL